MEEIEPQLDRGAVFELLMLHGMKPHNAGMYADIFVEYQDAQANIRNNGAICAHPRTGDSVPNPLLMVRDKAAKRLESMHKAGIKPPAGLWK